MNITDTIKYINQLPMTLTQFQKEYLIPQNYFNIYIHNLQNSKLSEYDRVDEEMLEVAKKINPANENKVICVIKPDSDVKKMSGKNSLEKRVNIAKKDVEIFNLDPFNKSYLSLISRMNYITMVFQMAFQETLRMNNKREKIQDIYSLEKNKTISDNLNEEKEDLLTLKSNCTTLQDNEREKSQDKTIGDNLNEVKEDLSTTMFLDEEQKNYIKQTFKKFSLKKVKDAVLDQIELYYGDSETIKNIFLNQLKPLNEFF